LVVALLYDGLCIFEYGIVAEIFGLARPEMGAGWYRFANAAIESGSLRTSAGFTIVADGDSALLARADLIVVPGWKGADEPVPPSLVAHLRAAHARGARLASICSGAFVLAATGLLDGAIVTTHWRYAEALRARFPKIRVDETSLYRQHDRLFTSAGSAAGIDLLIDLVRQDFGAAAANSVAQRIVMPAHRSGQQVQMLERPVAAREGAGISLLLDRIRESLTRPWTVADMAREASMSERTLVRRFVEATGMPPGEWLVVARLDSAKTFLAGTQHSVEDVAEAVGFASAHALRHHFRRTIGISPKEFRLRYVEPAPAGAAKRALRAPAVQG
jgi:AraC family transcriptional activator FtrA